MSAATPTRRRRAAAAPVQAGRGAVVYDLAGSGTPVVLLHGLGHRRQTWYPVMRELAGGHRLLALDLPGFGASDAPPPGARYDVASLADTVQRICSELGLERPHLAGNSLGGALALELGARGFAASVTAFSPAGFAPAATHAGLRLRAAGARAAGRVPEPVRVAAATSPPARAIARRVLRGDPASPAAARLAFDATLVSAGSPFVRLVPRIASYRFASPVPCPVTIAWGDRDRLLPPSGAPRALRRIPHARLVTLLGCGHIPMADAPHLVAAEIARTAAAAERLADG
ncbi:alpha/beta fold hydrolase [Nocardiopsis composta]|uniref:alpha/beta fold hydrolase n=1 Tax=Nocardiopsis composta TaxID=157465 RepID=UPI0031D75462